MVSDSRNRFSAVPTGQDGADFFMRHLSGNRGKGKDMVGCGNQFFVVRFAHGLLAMIKVVSA